MNLVTAYLEAHRDLLGLDALGVPRDPAFVLITPRFARSAHVVVLVLGDDGLPSLAAKLPRCAGGGPALAREADNLRAVVAALGDDGTTPAVLAFEEDGAHPLLVQRALRGTPLTGAALHRDLDGAVATVVGWCDRLACATARPGDPAVLERSLLAPLRALAERSDIDRAVRALARRTLPAAAAVAAAGVPHVYEHGDLGHPNLLLDEGGRIKVLDFERAQGTGLAGHDVAFFCAYAAVAISHHAPEQAVVDAFYGQRPWARDLLGRHLRNLGVGQALWDALVALSCARVVAAAGVPDPTSSTAARDAPRRHLALWSHALSAHGAHAARPRRSAA